MTLKRILEKIGTYLGLVKEKPQETPQPGKHYEYYNKLFHELARKNGRPFSTDEIEALKRHKACDEAYNANRDNLSDS